VYRDAISHVSPLAQRRKNAKRENTLLPAGGLLEQALAVRVLFEEQTHQTNQGF